MTPLAPAADPRYGPVEPSLRKRLAWCAEVMRHDAAQHTDPDRIAWRLRRAERFDALAKETKS